jgi:hypothetical protein
VVKRSWYTQGGEPTYLETALGPGTRAQIGAFGRAIVVDTDLLITGKDSAGAPTLRRIPLGAEPRALIGNYYRATVHLDGMLVQYDYVSTDMRSMSVGEGVLLPTFGDAPPVFFDGTTFHPLFSGPGALRFDDGDFTPRAEDLAALGAPAAVFHGVVLGEHGFLSATDATATVQGPRFLSFAELLGTDGRLGPVAVDSSAYVVKHEDGTAALYSAPFNDYCE